LHLLFLDRWNVWPLLTCYRIWRGPHGETIDGTNNACERGIDWWIKERYRTMRGYKRVKSAVNVSRLLAFCGNFLGRGGLALAQIAAEHKCGSNDGSLFSTLPNFEQSPGR
jgi:hypothetical protein